MKGTIRKAILALCALCALMAAVPARADLDFTGAKTLCGTAADLSADPFAGGKYDPQAAQRRYGDAACQNNNPLPHGGYVTFGLLNSDIAGRRIEGVTNGSVVPEIAAILARYGWVPGQALSWRDVRDLDSFQSPQGSTIAFEIELAYEQTKPRPAQPVVVTPLRVDQVRAILYEHGHPTAVFDRSVQKTWEGLKGLEAQAGEAKLRRSLVDAGFPPLPTAAVGTAAVDAAFDQLEALYAPLVAGQAADLAGPLAAIRAQLGALEDAIEQAPAAGSTFDPRQALATVRAAAATLEAANQTRPSQAKALDAVHRGVADLGSALGDDDPQFGSRAFDTNPVIR